MKKLTVAAIVIAVSASIWSCKKDEESNTTSQYSSEEAQAYQEEIRNEEPIDKLLRIMAGSNSAQSSSKSNTEASSPLKKLKLATDLPTDLIDLDYCELLNAQSGTSGFGFETCATQTSSCENGIYTTTTNYYEGCADAPGEDAKSYFGKVITSMEVDGIFSGEVASNYEFVNYGEVGDPTITNATGSSTTDATNRSKTKGTYHIQEIGELLTLDVNFETWYNSNYDSFGKIDYSGSSDFGYSFSASTTEDLAFKQCEVSILGNVNYAVSGKEKFTLIVDGKTHNFISDHGNGECDGIYTLTDDDGNVVDIDEITGQKVVQ